ncbi:MAG: hypothetical protein ACJAWW_001633 [Sulfurimonas sp.]|jgi:hypothetical protein
MYKIIDETIVKVVILLSLFFLVMFLGYSGSLFHFGDFSATLMLLHKYAGFTLLGLTLVHILMKKNKVKKISEEFINLLLGKNIKHTNNKEELLEVLKKKSLEELCLLFNIKMQDLLLTLKNNNIEVSDSKEKLSKIAKANSKDLYQMLILILKEHIVGERKN